MVNAISEMLGLNIKKDIFVIILEYVDIILVGHDALLWPNQWRS